jgi:hypothetical protein
MDRSGAGVNPTARWYSVLHLSSNFGAEGTQLLFMAKWDFSGPQQFPKAYILRKGGKGIFQYFRRFLFMGGSILTCEWIGIGVASYSPTKKALRIHQRWGYPFRRPRRILPGEVVWVAQTGDHHGDVPNFLLVNVVEKNHGAALRCRPCFPSPRTNRGPSHHLGAVLSGGKFQPTSPLFFRILKKP